jgi:hypothetical protein
MTYAYSVLSSFFTRPHLPWGYCFALRLFVRLFIRLSVSKISQKVLEGFILNLVHICSTTQGSIY